MRIWKSEQDRKVLFLYSKNREKKGAQHDRTDSKRNY
nr:MAG TPA: hypothetical protein [Caudoviricetes sp.]